MSRNGQYNTCVIYRFWDRIVADYKIWDFCDSRGRNAIFDWAKGARLSTKARAALDNKIKRLSQVDHDLAIKTKLLAGPIHKHVYKLRVRADVELRPMLCRGPISNLSEYTFLLGAIEVGGKLPDGAKEQAEQNRLEVIGDPTNRRTDHRKFHG